MSVTLISLDKADPASLRELLVKTCWKRDWNDEVADRYLAWRFGARGGGETLVAADRGRCVGILDSFLRPYSIAGQQHVVRETCDWFCEPKYRVLGVGLHLMRRMMARPEPMLVIGGTSFTQSLLPRLKWARLPDVANFVLGISARTCAGLVAHKWWPKGVALARMVPAIPLPRSLRWLSPPSPNSQARLHKVGEAGAAPTAAPYVAAPVLEPRLLDWLAQAPAVLGQFLMLSFFCDGELVGTSISRLQELPAFGYASQIVHVHAARFEVIDWMVSETVRHLIERGAGAIQCRSSCPATGRALSALGFWRLKPIPAYWWPAEKAPPSGPLNFTKLQADDALQFN